MPIDLSSPQGIEELLLEFKYREAVRRVARGVTHSYNNIFTGLGGQLAILRQDAALPADGSNVRRSDLLDNLLQRGVEQTAALYDFVKGTDPGGHTHSPLLVADKAMELLNSISRVHRFVLRHETRQEKMVCNLRDAVLILFYLGENCIDATPEGGDIHLTVTLQEEGKRRSGAIAFSFHDHGPGFSQEILSARFAPFATTREGSHRGLGLFAADALARRNRGRLAIASGCPGKTTVRAVFPAQDEGTAEETLESRPGQRRRDDNLAKQCILIVEDDEALRTLLVYRLQRRGHMVFCVDTCAEALEEYEQLHDIITVILMDVGLRDASGYACLREMLKIETQARIIFMSGHNEAVPAELAGHAFLPKPFTLDLLEQTIQDIHEYQTSN